MTNKLTCLLLLTCIFLLLLSCAKESHLNDYIAKVNGEKVSLPEFNSMLQKNRAMVYNYFYEQYGAEDHEEFWTTKYGGEIPIERLKKIALDECVRIKIQQILAKQKKIVDDISYSAFCKEYKKENKTRRRAVTNKKIVFGPVEFNQQTFFNYTFSNMVLKLKERLAEDEFVFSDSLLKSYYEQNKENYRQQDFIKVEKISVYFYDPHSAKPLLNKPEARALIKKVQAEIKGKTNSAAAVQNMADKRIKFECQVFDHSSAFTDDRLFSDLKNIAAELSVGEYSPIIEDEFGFHILKCIQRLRGDYIPYEEVRDVIHANLIDKKYEQFFDELVSKAKIEINHSTYAAIKEI